MECSQAPCTKPAFLAFSRNLKECLSAIKRTGIILWWYNSTGGWVFWHKAPFFLFSFFSFNSVSSSSCSLFRLSWEKQKFYLCSTHYTTYCQQRKVGMMNRMLWYWRKEEVWMHNLPGCFLCVRHHVHIVTRRKWVGAKIKHRPT